MLVAYLDETYLNGTQHAIVALVLPAEKVGELEEKLNDVVKKARRQHDCLPEDIELHGYELSGGEGDWQPIKPRARIRVYKEAVEAIASVEGAVICLGAVDLSNKQPRDAHYWALTIALECVDSFAERLGQNVIGICDDVGNKSVYQKMYAQSRKHGTGGNFPKYLEQFSDGLHFTPSCFSRLVQAVDLLAYVYRRVEIIPFEDPRPAKVMQEIWTEMRTMWQLGCQRTWS